MHHYEILLVLVVVVTFLMYWLLRDYEESDK
jgi:hypothetical protein